MTTRWRNLLLNALKIIQCWLILLTTVPWHCPGGNNFSEIDHITIQTFCFQENIIQMQNAILHLNCIFLKTKFFQASMSSIKVIHKITYIFVYRFSNIFDFLVTDMFFSTVKEKEAVTFFLIMGYHNLNSLFPERSGCDIKKMQFSATANRLMVNWINLFQP